MREGMSIWNRSCRMWCTLGSTRTMTWISECGGLMTLLQPSHPLCYQGSSAIFVSWGGRGTQRTCLSQDGRGPVGSQWSSHWARCTRPLTHRWVGTSCEWPKWRPKGTSCVSREGSTLTKPSLGLTQRMQLLLSYWMMMRLTSPLIRLRLSLHRKLNQPETRSDPWRIGVHAHLLQRSGLQKKRRRVCLLVKQFYPKG